MQRTPAGICRLLVIPTAIHHFYNKWYAFRKIIQKEMWYSHLFFIGFISKRYFGWHCTDRTNPDGRGRW